MSINKAFAVSIEANRKKQEMQREAVLLSGKVFKSLPEAKRNYENTLGHQFRPRQHQGANHHIKGEDFEHFFVY